MSIRKRTWETGEGESREAWVVDYFDRVAGKRRLRTFAKKKDAESFRDRTGVEIREGRHVSDRDSITVDAMAEIWISAVAKGRGDHGPAEYSTLRQYKSHHKHHINPYLGGLKLSQINKAQVAAFRDHLLGKLSRPMAAKVMRSFKSLMAEAEARGYVAVNAARSVKIGTGKRHKAEVEIPSKADIKAILAKLDELASQSNPKHAKAWRRWRVFLTTAIYSGFRASELRGLPWKDVDLKAGTLTVSQRADERGVIGSPKSLSSRRTISIPDHLVALLRTWKLECPAGALVFPNWRGKVERLSDIHGRAWTPLQLAAGITRPKTDALGNPLRDADGRPLVRPKFNFHALRHFRASLLIEQGANFKELQSELGHTDIAMTVGLYGHLFKDEAAKKERAERAERIAATLA
jgi:integrase